jgi:predicted methyltransferase
MPAEREERVQGLVDQARRNDAILAVLQVEREALVRLRNEGQIDDEVLRTLLREPCAYRFDCDALASALRRSSCSRVISDLLTEARLAQCRATGNLSDSGRNRDAQHGNQGQLRSATLNYDWDALHTNLGLLVTYMKRVINGRVQRMYCVRVALFLIGTLLLGVMLSYLYQGIQTLYALDQIERERDQWQRPSDVIYALNLHEGSVVVDFGSGVGYFTLKLSPLVGKNGVVVAEDIRHQSLVFLRIRAFLRGQHNLKVIRGDTDDPRLPTGSADAVLILNAYHELTAPKPILHRLADSLKAGGRLVIVDRGPRSDGAEPRGTQPEHHELRPDLVEAEVRSAGFQIISRQDRFIDRPGDHQVWWLMVSRK